MKYVLIGAGSDLGVHVNGAKYGPSRIINSINNNNIEKKVLIQKDGIIKSNDKNDLEKNLIEVNLFNQELYRILNSYDKDKFLITIGGDHSISIASGLTSCNKESVGLIWIDAHPDFNTFETTITGNLHGLPCACINHYGCDKLSLFHNGNYINPKNTVIVGARSIDKKEMENLQKTGVIVFTTNDIKKYGVKNIMEQAFSIATKDTNKIHLSYDLDVIDPKIAPGVSVPEVNGINEQEAYEIADYIARNINYLVGMDLVEYNPIFDINDRTLQIAINILNKLIK